jgi:Gas vesicle protein
MTVEHVHHDAGGTLADVLDRILDKGLIINADITVSAVGVELLGIKLRAALASFETAARYGLEFPSGVDRGAPAWRALEADGNDLRDTVALPVGESLPVPSVTGLGREAVAANGRTRPHHPDA